MTAVDGWISVNECALLPYAPVALAPLAPAFAADKASRRHLRRRPLAIAISWG